MYVDLMCDPIQVLAMQNALLGSHFEWMTALLHNTCVNTERVNFSKYCDELDCQAQKRQRKTGYGLFVS